MNMCLPLKLSLNILICVISRPVRILIINPTRCTNFSNLFFMFLNETLHVSDSSSVHHQEFFTVHTAIHTSLLTACELSTNLNDIHHSCVYSGELLMMDRGTVRNTYSFIPKIEINLRNWCI